MSSDEEDSDCPLCMEELDIADRNFRPCPCGYQICRFCWHHIKTNLNGRCPACRRLYSDQIVEFVPVSAEEIVRLKKEKKEKDRQTRDMRDPSRRQLSNVRVVQKNLVYVLGLSLKHASVDNELFKKYGRIDKVVISKRSTPSTGSNSSVGIYVTFTRKEDAHRAIEGMNGMEYDGKTLRASYGTTKYCTYYLRHMSCPNPNCMYLHEPGDDVDSYSKDTVSIGKHANTSLSSSSTTTYPNKRPAIAVRLTPVASSSTTTATTPETRPATVPRTWAPIPKVVPIPPVVIPKEESPVLEATAPPSPPFKEITKSSSSSSKKMPVRVSKSSGSKKPLVERSKKIVIPLVPEEDERPALPPTASWAKAPVVNHESVITPANFGPSLSDALNAPQKPKHSPSLKVKKEKKIKGKMVRLEEFEEAEREAKMAATRPKVVPKPVVAESSKSVHVESKTNHVVTPVSAPVIDQSVPEIKKEETKEKAKSEMVEQEVKPEMVEINKSSTVEEPVVEKPIIETPVVEQEPCIEAEEEIEDEEEEEQRDEIMQENDSQDNQQDLNDDDDIVNDEDEEEFEFVKTEHDTEKIENLASLNESIIKAFDHAANESSEKVQSDENRQKDTEDDLLENEIIEKPQTISSPMAAMDRLSALVQQEIMNDSPEEPQFDEVDIQHQEHQEHQEQQEIQRHQQQHQQHQQMQQHQQQMQQQFQQQHQQQGPHHPGMNRFDMLPIQPDNRRSPMPPPGLGNVPPPPEWMNRSFDPFNGQDPSLIAARRLQHSQRMLEASGLFGGGGFGPPPVVPRFGFSPDFNHGHSGFHPPPPPPLGMFPPPPHPMMRGPPPPPEMMSPFGPPPPPPPMQMDELRNEFNNLKMNNGEEHQSREDFRALLPNVNISFNNLQEKRRAEEFYQQHMFIRQQQQQQQQQHQHQQQLQMQQQQQQQQQRMSEQRMSEQRMSEQRMSEQRMSEQRMSEQRMSEQRMSEQRMSEQRMSEQGENGPMRHPSFNSFSSQDKILTRSPAHQWQDENKSEGMEEKRNPDVRVEAQNFFGEFLRKAASSTPQPEMSPKKEEPAGTLPFQDPAIMSVHLVGNEAPVNELVRSQNTILQILGGQPPPPSPLTMEQQHHHQQMHQFHQQQQQHQQRQMDPRFSMEQNRMMHQEGNFNEMGPKHFNNMFMGHPPPPNFQQQQQQQFHHQPSSFMPGFREPNMGMMGRMGPPPGMMRPPMPPNDMRFRNNGPMNNQPPPGMFNDENRH